VVNRDSTDAILTSFFIPASPYLTITPPVIQDYTLFTQTYDFSVRVDSMNQGSESVIAYLNVLNAQTNVEQNNSNAGYLFNSTTNPDQTLYIEDTEWTKSGSMFNYTILGGQASFYTSIINHLMPG
jgi:hypothetical protein